MSDIFWRMLFFSQYGVLRFNIFTKLLAITLNVMVKKFKIVDTFNWLFAADQNIEKISTVDTEVPGKLRAISAKQRKLSTLFFHSKMCKYFSPNIFFTGTVFPPEFCEMAFPENIFTRTHQISDAKFRHLQNCTPSQFHANTTQNTKLCK